MKELIVILTLASFFGCATAKKPVAGFVFTGIQSADDTNEASFAKQKIKSARACARSYLGLVARGDASIERAKKAADIKKVIELEYQTFSVLGLYAKYCTVVRGY